MDSNHQGLYHSVAPIKLTTEVSTPLTTSIPVVRILYKVTLIEPAAELTFD